MVKLGVIHLQDWIPAVALLVDACSKISRQEVAKVSSKLCRQWLPEGRKRRQRP